MVDPRTANEIARMPSRFGEITNDRTAGFPKEQAKQILPSAHTARVLPSLKLSPVILASLFAALHGGMCDCDSECNPLVLFAKGVDKRAKRNVAAFGTVATPEEILVFISERAMYARLHIPPCE